MGEWRSQRAGWDEGSLPPRAGGRTNTSLSARVSGTHVNLARNILLHSDAGRPASAPTAEGMAGGEAPVSPQGSEDTQPGRVVKPLLYT